MPGRMGLIKARQMGCKMAEGDVIVIFDSHMEVNIDWLVIPLTGWMLLDHIVPVFYMYGNSCPYVIPLHGYSL